MKKTIIYVFAILFILFFIIICYKFGDVGNNKNIENIDEFDKYISKIKNYKLEALVTVNSNKNSNTYSLKQECQEDKVIQNIESPDGLKLTIENYNDKIIVKNTSLALNKVFNMYKEPFRNSLGLDEFVNDYNDDDRKELVERNGYYVANVKVNNSDNKYIKSKTLYFNKEKNQIEKMEIKDINNNRTIIIEYTMLQIL
jgi:outer membrane lipoprotein-sorting protein